MTVLLDGTVLSNFAAIGRLDLLSRALDEAYIASAVREEVVRGVRLGHSFLAQIEQQVASSGSSRWLLVAEIESDEELILLQSMPPKLGVGEAMSLAIAKVRGWTVVTDDAAARATARRLGIPLGGTLGILRHMTDMRMLTIDEANRLLTRMIDEAGYRSPVVDLRQLRSS